MFVSKYGFYITISRSIWSYVFTVMVALSILTQDNISVVISIEFLHRIIVTLKVYISQASMQLNWPGIFVCSYILRRHGANFGQMSTWAWSFFIKGYVTRLTYLLEIVSATWSFLLFSDDLFLSWLTQFLLNIVRNQSLYGRLEKFDCSDELDQVQIIYKPRPSLLKDIVSLALSQAQKEAFWRQCGLHPLL